MGLPEPNDSEKIEWFYILILAGWGGIVRYILDVREGVISKNLCTCLTQIIISTFVGVVAGLLAQRLNATAYTTLAITGITSAMGATALSYFWLRLTGMGNGKS